MNNAKLWLVVQPTIGIPLFLTAVAVGSFSVHLAVVRNTTWVSDYLSGKPLGTGSESAALAPAEGSVKLTSTASVPAGQEILITLPDGKQVRAVVEESATTLASLTGPGAIPSQ